MRRHRRPAAPDQRCTLLAGVVGGSPEEAVELAQHPLVRSSPRDHDALVSVFGRLAATSADPDARRGRLLQLVVDVEQRPLADAATLLALSPRDAHALLDGARQRSGSPRGAGRCRGWPLVVGPRTLTAPEQRAAAGHLEVCRDCRDHRAAIERARREALARAGAVTALLGAGQVAALTTAGGVTSAGASGLLAGKAAAALVGVLGAAVVAGGSVAAVAQHDARDAARVPAVHAPADVRPAAPGPPTESKGDSCAASCAVEATEPVPPPVTQPSPSPAVPAPALQLPAGGGTVVLVPPSAPAVPSVPAVPSLPGVSSTPSLLPLPAVEPVPSVPSLP